MAVSDQKFDKLLTKVDGISDELIRVRERLVRAEEALKPRRHGLQTVVVSLAGTAILAYLGWLGVETYQHNASLASRATFEADTANALKSVASDLDSERDDINNIVESLPLDGRCPEVR